MALSFYAESVFANRACSLTVSLYYQLESSFVAISGLILPQVTRHQTVPGRSRILRVFSVIIRLFSSAERSAS